ncbi:hypothetical protein D3C74_91870 [compost metagenome]
MTEIYKDEMEKAFDKMKANFRFEGIEIKNEEKQLFFDFYTGKIAQKEFYEKMGVKDSGL